MPFHRTTVAALAASVFLTFFAAEGSGANAETSETREARVLALTDETVPQPRPGAQPEPPQFVSQPVVQAAPEPAADDAAAAAPRLARASSLSQLVAAMPRGERLSAQLECLAGAIYFEARGEPLAGQLAVGQVIVNRSESGRFPQSYCGVVYQPSQFSFVRGGRMPAIDRASAAWTRASAIARIAHEGLWDSAAGDALFFHARYVKPDWSRTKLARATIDTHIFYR